MTETSPGQAFREVLIARRKEHGIPCDRRTWDELPPEDREDINAAVKAAIEHAAEPRHIYDQYDDLAAENEQLRAEYKRMERGLDEANSSAVRAESSLVELIDRIQENDPDASAGSANEDAAVGYVRRLEQELAMTLEVLTRVSPAAARRIAAELNGGQEAGR